MIKRPVTTLFLLTSLDGKISTGCTDVLDFDADLPFIDGIKEGLHQYYEIEQTTDLWSLNSGRVQAKIGVNEKALPDKTPVSFVLIDNSHLKESGVRYFCAKSDKFVLITSNKAHPAFRVKAENLHILYQESFKPEKALEKLFEDFACKRITVQTGGTLNAEFIRRGLIDYVDIVVAPLIVGGKDTPTLVDGRSFTTKENLKGLGVLELESMEKLEDSYIRLRYRVKKTDTD